MESNVDLPLPEELPGAIISQAGNYPNQYFEDPGFFSEPSGNQYKGGVNKLNTIIVFGDIRKYSLIAENQYLDQTVDYLSVFFTDVSSILRPLNKEDGIMKFMGDGFFISLKASHESAVEVAKKALDLNREFQHIAGKIDRRRLDDRFYNLELSLAIVQGEVGYCVLGGEDYRDYTIIGKRVNSASRFCSVAIGNQIILDKEVRTNYNDGFVYVYTGKLDLKHVDDEESYSLIRPKKEKEIELGELRECCAICSNYDTFCSKRFKLAKNGVRISSNGKLEYKKIYEFECDLPDTNNEGEPDANNGGEKKSVRDYCYYGCDYSYLCLINTALGQSGPNVGVNEPVIRFKGGAQMVCCDKCPYFAKGCPKYDNG